MLKAFEYVTRRVEERKRKREKERERELKSDELERWESAKVGFDTQTSSLYIERTKR